MGCLAITDDVGGLRLRANGWPGWRVLRDMGILLVVGWTITVWMVGFTRQGMLGLSWWEILCPPFTGGLEDWAKWLFVNMWCSGPGMVALVAGAFSSLLTLYILVLVAGGGLWSESLLCRGTTAEWRFRILGMPLWRRVIPAAELQRLELGTMFSSGTRICTWTIRTETPERRQRGSRQLFCALTGEMQAYQAACAIMDWAVAQGADGARPLRDIKAPPRAAGDGP